jgi:hypothetical protein
VQVNLTKLNLFAVFDGGSTARSSSWRAPNRGGADALEENGDGDGNMGASRTRNQRTRRRSRMTRRVETPVCGACRLGVCAGLQVCLGHGRADASLTRACAGVQSRRFVGRMRTPWSLGELGVRDGDALPSAQARSFALNTGGKRAYGPGSFGSLVPVAEPGSITRDQCRSRFQHEPGPIGLHVDALRREGA